MRGVVFDLKVSFIVVRHRAERPPLTCPPDENALLGVVTRCQDGLPPHNGGNPTVLLETPAIPHPKGEAR